MTANGSLCNELELKANVDGTITTVTLFPYRADVTRTFSRQLDCGLTRVKISSGFPSSFDSTQLRVDVSEGIALQDVEVVWAESSVNTTAREDKIDALYNKESLVQKSLDRCKRMTAALDTYAKDALNKDSTMSPLDIGRFLDSYEEAGKKWDEKIACLEKELRDLGNQIDEEEKSDGSDPSEATKYSRAGVTFMLSTETPKLVTFKVTYGVKDAYWNAGYDLFATSDNDEAVSIVYKAFVSNNTDEAWNDVELKFESVGPQATMRLQPWKLNFQAASGGWGDVWGSVSSYPPPKILVRAQRKLLEIVSLPSKTNDQSFVLGRHTLTATLSRFCTPKISSDVSIKANVTNTCDYPIRSASSGIYIDGNFISNVRLPSVNPGETFDVTMGVDPAIQVVYHPCIKDNTVVDPSTPFTFKPVSTYLCSQRISIQNSRAVNVTSLTIIDQIPTSEDVDILVKLADPPLKYPESIASGLRDGGHARAGIQVTEGVPKTCSVLARWDMIDEPLQDLSMLGTNGKINWVCSVGGKESMDLNLQWQVLVYSSKQIKDF